MLHAGRCSQQAEGWERRGARFPFHLSNGTGSGMKRTGRGSEGENQRVAARIDVPVLWMKLSLDPFPALNLRCLGEEPAL